MNDTTDSLGELITIPYGVDKTITLSRNGVEKMVETYLDKYTYVKASVISSSIKDGKDLSA